MMPFGEGLVVSAGLPGSLTAAAAAAPAPGLLAWQISLDLAAVGLLVYVIYRRRHHNTEMMLALTVLNVGLFASLAAITSGDFSIGAGFGLFGMLSLIRLRSASFSTVDMAYTFLALVVGLVSGVPTRHWWFAASLVTLLLLLAAVADHPRLHRQTQTVEVLMDRVYSSAASIEADVRARTGRSVLSCAVLEVDYVREVTRVRVVFPAVEAGPVIQRPLLPVPGSRASLRRSGS